MDFAFRYLPRRMRTSCGSSSCWVALAHMTKPIGQLTMNLITGWPFGSFRYGVLYPFASHLLFGMIGGVLGALIVLGIRRYSKKTDS